MEEAKTPLSMANAEVENLKKELIAARRQELGLQKNVSKVIVEKEAQPAKCRHQFQVKTLRENSSGLAFN